MNQKQKEETIEIFAEAFHEVVVPVLEDLATKKDLKMVGDRLGRVEGSLDGVEERLGGVEERLDTLDNKVEMINRRLITVTDHQADMLDDHEKRIGKLETRVNN